MLISHLWTKTVLIGLLLRLRRQHIPRVMGYTENIIPQFVDFDCRYHFRIDKGMCEEVLRIIGPFLTCQDHSGGIADTPKKKQLLVFLCYLANQASIREISHYFGLSISSVHKLNRKVGKVITEKLTNVSIDTQQNTAIV